MSAESGEAPISRKQQRAARSKKKRNPVASFFIELIIIAGTAVLLSFLITTFFVRAFFIPSQSMEPTLEVGDRILVNLLAPGPFTVDRGDVVVFEDTDGTWSMAEEVETNAFQDALQFVGLAPDTSSSYVVKRLIGLPGDDVSCCDDQGRIMVNGVSIDEPYVDAGSEPSEIEFDVTVPEGYVWLLGDNRLASADSRFHIQEEDQGAVPIEDVVGRAAVTIWPLENIGGGGSVDEPFEDVPEPAETPAN